MIVFDLRCGQRHVFEARFASSASYEQQREQGLVNCPFCDDHVIEKAAMAPNIAAKGNRSAVHAPPPEILLTTLAAAQAKALETSEWVGRSFPDRARSMHLGDEAFAPIHGETSKSEALELIEEGVPIAPLLFPVVPRTVQN